MTDRFGFHLSGKDAVIRWFLRRRGAPLNDADAESGWTPLHRAIYYGQVVFNMDGDVYGLGNLQPTGESQHGRELCLQIGKYSSS